MEDGQNVFETLKVYRMQLAEKEGGDFLMVVDI